MVLEANKHKQGGTDAYVVGVKVLVYDVTVPYERTLLQYGEPTAGAPRIHLKTLSRLQAVVDTSRSINPAATKLKS